MQEFTEFFLHPKLVCAPYFVTASERNNVKCFYWFLGHLAKLLSFELVRTLWIGSGSV